VTDFRILGPLQAHRDGDELGLGGRNQRAVLALLLLQANQVVSIERLAEELYGDATPVSAVTQVHRQVSELRRVLDLPRSDADAASVIETRAPGYVIRVGTGGLDLHRFETLTGDAAAAMEAGDARSAADALREALALWRGPALADLAYESFAQAPISRLEELRLGALLARLEAELALGHHVASIPELQDLAAAHPQRERVRELLMVALYRSGRQVEALDVYRATRAELVETFGVEPGPGLQRVEQAILRHDPELAGPQSEAPKWGDHAGAVVLAGRDPARLGPLVAIAEPLARQPRRELIIGLLVDEEAQLAEATTTLAAVRAGLEAPARTAAFVASRGSDDVLHLARSYDADLVLLDASTGIDESGTLSKEVVDVLDGSPADVGLLFASAPAASGARGVLVPFGGGEHDWAAVELGAWLAAALGEPLRLVGARPDPARGGPDASRLLADASLAVQRLVGVAAEPTLVDAGTSGLIDASSGARAVVVGLSPRWRSDGLGAARHELVRDPGCAVLVVHRGLRPSGIAPRESATRFTWSLGGG
jgi:DNA-binding SARP family transcriptional activator